MWMSEYRFAVRVRPGARKDAVGGRWDGPKGVALLVSVAAPAVDGKANEAVRRVLAGALGVRRQQLTLVAGERGRDKIILWTEAPADGADRVGALINMA
jgi:uncharacterized protein YggU (UPF0235/DUF167 family)